MLRWWKVLFTKKNYLRCIQIWPIFNDDDFFFGHGEKLISSLSFYFIYLFKSKYLIFFLFLGLKKKYIFITKKKPTINDTQQQQQHLFRRRKKNTRITKSFRVFFFFSVTSSPSFFFFAFLTYCQEFCFLFLFVVFFISVKTMPNFL